MTFPPSSTPLAGINHARLPAWTLPSDWPTQANGEPMPADLTFRDGRIAALTPTDQPAPDLWGLTGALTLPDLVELHTHLNRAFTIGCCRPAQAGLLAAIHAMYEDRQHWTRADVQRRTSAALVRAAASGVTHLRNHIDWFATDAPDAWQELARLDTVGITLERVALVPLTLFRGLADAGAIARTVATSKEGYLLGGFIRSFNWDATAMANLLGSATRWDLDLNLYIDEELSEVSQGLTWLTDHLFRHPFPGHICCNYGCALAAGSDEQTASILRQLATHGIILIALPITNLLLQDVTFGHTSRQRGITLLHEVQVAGMATLIGCDNVRDASCPTEGYDPLNTLAYGLFSAQPSDLFNRQSRLTCDYVALTGSPMDAAPFAIGAAASVVIFPGSDRFTWPLNSAACLMVNHGRLTHRRVRQEKMAHES